MIQESTLIDQPRNMKLRNIEDIVNIQTLNYVLSLVNGYVLMKLKKDSNQFSYDIVMGRILALARQGHSIRLRLEIDQSQEFDVQK